MSYSQTQNMKESINMRALDTILMEQLFTFCITSNHEAGENKISTYSSTEISTGMHNVS